MAARTVMLLTNTVYGDSTYEVDLWTGAWKEAQQSSIPLITIVAGQLTPDGRGGTRVPFMYKLAAHFQAMPAVINAGTMQQGLGAEALHTFVQQFPATAKVVTAIPVAGVRSVMVDNFAGMRDIVAHLVGSLGRKRPLYISGPYENSEAQERLRAFRETLQAHGLPIREEDIAEGTWMGPSAIEVLRRALANKVPFDAVVCANDLMAIAVLEELYNQGVKVPEDVVVSGFDDIEAARFSHPPLSTVFQPIRELGGRAVAMASESTGESKARVPARIVYRASAPREASRAAESTGQQELEELRQLYRGLKQNESLMNAMGRVNRILNQVSRLSALETAVAEAFAACGIRDCSVVLLDGPSEAWTGARRIVHVADGSVLPAGATFPLISPLPEESPQAGKDWLLLPLSFEEQDLGYLVFQRAEVSPFVYEALANQLAGVLHSLLLIDRVQQAEALAASRADRIGELVRPMIASIQETGSIARDQSSVMQVLVSTNTESAERLAGMDSQVGQIRNDLKHVMDLISAIEEVAETISVIAINASIAAARAGSNGKVFGVISAEIRKLSIQTKENTAQIAAVLETLGANAQGFFESSHETRTVFSRLEGEIQKLLESLNSIQGAMSAMNGQAEQVLQTLA